jgi:UDP-N-acetylmuramate--alanine ligase
MTAWKGRRLHFVAIGGAGMSGLALLTKELGAEVSGSDVEESGYVERLRSVGIEPLIGHAAAAVPQGADVVYSTAVPKDNPEITVAKERGQRLMHRSELLAELAAERRVIAISGTHGKTTTASLLTFVLRQTGEDPGFALGGDLHGAGPGGSAVNAGWGSGDWMVVEADESDGSFRNLSPEVAVVTNVELDHHARWASRIELLEAFAGFVAPAKGLALGPYRDLDAIKESSTARVLRFGAATEGDDSAAPGSTVVRPEVAATDIEQLESGGRAFTLVVDGRDRGRVELAIPGDHNLLNALAALAAVELAGLDVSAAAAAVAGFRGAARRL